MLLGGGCPTKMFSILYLLLSIKINVILKILQVEILTRLRYGIDEGEQTKATSAHTPHLQCLPFARLKQAVIPTCLELNGASILGVVTDTFRVNGNEYLPTNAM